MDNLELQRRIQHAQAFDAVDVEMDDRALVALGL